MADGVPIKTGTDATIASDDIAGVHYQRNKLIHGADGVNDGDISTANGLPVQNDRVSSISFGAGTSSASSMTLAASNSARKGLIIFNDSTSALYVRYGTPATTAIFTVKIAAGGYWEMPAPIYTGQVCGIWDSANGVARVTES